MFSLGPRHTVCKCTSLLRTLLSASKVEMPNSAVDSPMPKPRARIVVLLRIDTAIHQLSKLGSFCTARILPVTTVWPRLLHLVQNYLHSWYTAA